MDSQSPGYQPENHSEMVSRFLRAWRRWDHPLCDSARLDS